MSRLSSRLIFALAVFTLGAHGALAASTLKTEHVEAELVTDDASAQPGKSTLVGLKLRMARDWHTYWKNPGDSGLPTKIQWTLPEGWKAGDIQWPYPQPLPVGPLLNYGYDDEVVLLVSLTPPANAPEGPAAIKAHAEWLVCKDICVPEKGDLDISFPVSKAEPKKNPMFQAHIDRARNQLPLDVAGWKSEASMSGMSLVVRLTAPEGAAPPAKAHFFPERESLIEPAAPEKLTVAGRTLTIEMKLADPPLTDVKTLKGVVVSESGWNGSDGRKAMNVVASVGAAALPGASGTTSRVGESVGGSTMAALLFAFIGGILLNLMPCVFPVLGIKVMGFVEHAHGDQRTMKLQGLVFTAGVIVSFLVLAGLMLALRAGGTQLGWGFQLQSPVFVTLLAALFFVLALNLSGVFEWGAFAQSMTSNLSARGRYADAFLSGVLATVVATPCTAPFMGAAVGFTLTQDWLHSLVVFTALAAGMALPVLLLSLFPALLKRLPRPGVWMETFKQVLAFPLYATVAWLAWVLGAQAGNDAVLALLAGLVLIAMGAWMQGRSANASGIWRSALAAVFVAVGIVVALPGAPAEGSQSMAHDENWQEWSPEKVRDLVASGKPVFVDFTAAWCVTCQVNKRVALYNVKVAKAFADREVITMKADWTRQDPRITATLAALGRNAVPVYAFYVPGENEPRLLPEVLTPSLVLDEISRLPAARVASAAAPH
ncbi:MAG TPA: protein-disulfide reductase DsbD domain-containing protein [Usitatibacter sp.]